MPQSFGGEWKPSLSDHPLLLPHKLPPFSHPLSSRFVRHLASLAGIAIATSPREEGEEGGRVENCIVALIWRK